MDSSNNEGIAAQRVAAPMMAGKSLEDQIIAYVGWPGRDVGNADVMSLMAKRGYGFRQTARALCNAVDKKRIFVRHDGKLAVSVTERLKPAPRIPPKVFSARTREESNHAIVQDALKRVAENNLAAHRGAMVDMAACGSGAVHIDASGNARHVQIGELTLTESEPTISRLDKWRKCLQRIRTGLASADSQASKDHWRATLDRAENDMVEDLARYGVTVPRQELTAAEFAQCLPVVDVGDPNAVAAPFDIVPGKIYWIDEQAEISKVASDLAVSHLRKPMRYTTLDRIAIETVMEAATTPGAQRRAEEEIAARGRAATSWTSTWLDALAKTAETSEPPSATSLALQRAMGQDQQRIGLFCP